MDPGGSANYRLQPGAPIGRPSAAGCVTLSELNHLGLRFLCHYVTTVAFGRLLVPAGVLKRNTHPLK